MDTRFRTLIALGLLAIATTAAAITPAESPAPTPQSRRAEVYPQVSNYLTAVAALEPERIRPELEFSAQGWLPRWVHKVCLKVEGLPEPDAKFIQSRVAQIARDAGVRMAADQCRPNLFVFVTAQPKELLTKMVQKGSESWFGYRGLPHIVDEFIATPRPVRVWYNLGSEEHIESVLLIVDQSQPQVQGATLTQFADYIAVAGFAQVKPLALISSTAQVGDVPTILKLFDGSPKAAPASATNLDKAFLTSLYANSWPRPWNIRFGRSNGLALSMVSQIAP